MPPILVSSSAKHIATHILVIAKLSGTRDFILGGFVCDTNVPARNYLFKVSNWSTRIRCENCSKLRIKTLERCQWRHSNVFIVNCEHISSFVLIVEFEQANVCWVHIEKTNTFEDKIGYIMRYVAVFSVWTKFINKWHLNLSHHNPLYQWWISEKLLRRSLLPTLILPKKMGLTFKVTCCTFVFLQIVLAWRLFRSYLTQLILNCCKLLLSC